MRPWYNIPTNNLKYNCVVEKKKAWIETGILSCKVDFHHELHFDKIIIWAEVPIFFVKSELFVLVAKKNKLFLGAKIVLEPDRLL